MSLRPFELGLVVVFILLLVGSLIFLRVYKPSNNDENLIGAVEIWGTVPAQGVSDLLDAYKLEDETYKQVEYRYIPASEFEEALTQALADNRGPDVLLLQHDLIVPLRSKLRPISYESYPLRDIETRYIDGAQIFALSDGLYAYPLMVDPLVMFWNKDLLAKENFVSPPVTWESLVNQYLPLLTKRSPDRTIEQSTVAFGEYRNTTYAYDIIGMLLLQSGSQRVKEQAGTYEILLDFSSGQSFQPLTASLEFYTRFARADNSLYSWNRSFQSDQDQFISGELALYFARASEGVRLEKLNPNLSFDVAQVPQGATADVKRTHGTFYGLSLVRNSDNVAGATRMMQILSQTSQAKELADAYNMAPVERSTIAAGSNDRYGRTGYLSAVIAYGWLSPRRSALDQIFATTVRDIVENRSTPAEATGDTLGRLELEYN